MWKKIGLLLTVLLLLGVAGLAIWYRIDGQPLPEAAGYFESDLFSVATESDGSIVMTPRQPNGHGLLIMHGALIKPPSYARTAAFFAAEGYTVYLPSGAGRMSIAAVDRAARRLKEFAVRDWYAIGHSMGGMASLDVIQKVPDRFIAAALWAAAMPKDFKALKLPLLFLWGDRDGLLPPERYAQARQHLPASTRYVTISGGNHQDFAMYSHQFFDNPGTLGWEAQIDAADEITSAFFAAQQRPATAD